MVNFEISSDFLKVLVEQIKISINCRFNSIPQNIEGRIMEFMVTTWQQTKGIDTNAVVNLCPKDLKADICVHLHR